VPGSSPGKLAKGATLAVDEIVIDLEDAVLPAAKAAARAATVAALGESDWRAGAVAVRVNAARTPWCHLDLAALAACGERPLSIVLPKVEGAADLAFLERLLDGLEAAAGRRRPLRVQALIETAAGLANVAEIARASDRLDALILGYADLGASLGRAGSPAAGLDLWLPAQQALLVAARAAGLQAIDGPHLELDAGERFAAAGERARDLGFDGKWAIHPSQVGPLEDLFTPGEAEVERARAVIAALAEAGEGSGAGAVALDGEMVDEAVRLAAERVLVRAGTGPAG
jgi:citrate lyase subunit beta/citryl-CoA lyase